MCWQIEHNPRASKPLRPLLYLTLPPCMHVHAGDVLVLAGHKPQSNYPEGRRGLRILNMTTDSLQVRLHVQLHFIVMLFVLSQPDIGNNRGKDSQTGTPFPPFIIPHEFSRQPSTTPRPTLFALQEPSPAIPHHPSTVCHVPTPPPPVVLQDMSQLQYGHWLATATQLPNGMISVMSDSPAPVGPANLGPTSLGAIVKVGAAAFPSLPYTPPPPA